MDTGDYVEILWAGGVTEGVYVDHRDGGRVLVEYPQGGVEVMSRSEFGRCSIKPGVKSRKTARMQHALDGLVRCGAADDTTAQPDSGTEGGR